MSEPKAVVEVEGVWKIFGVHAHKAMEAVRAEGLGKPEVLERFGCVVGVQDATFSVREGEIFCIMGLSGSPDRASEPSPPLRTEPLLHMT